MNITKKSKVDKTRNYLIFNSTEMFQKLAQQKNQLKNFVMPLTKAVFDSFIFFYLLIATINYLPDKFIRVTQTKYHKNKLSINTWLMVYKNWQPFLSFNK